ncbi:MAG: GatB/YqeY domain-containing protein, partial [Myxococcota bacterium]
GREEMAAAERAELAVLQAFLPSLADEATTARWVDEAIAASGAASAKEIGKVMGALMKAHKGEMDGNLARAIAAKKLGG